jgi:hypothetical protein
MKLKALIKTTDKLDNDSILAGIGELIDECDGKAREGLLWTAKGIRVFQDLERDAGKGWAIDHLSIWRKGCTYLAYAKTQIKFAVDEASADKDRLRAGLQIDAIQALKRRSLRESEDKILCEIRRTSKNFQRLEAKLSYLNVILGLVKDLLIQYNNLKDIIVQESVNTRKGMSDGAQEF